MRRLAYIVVIVLAAAFTVLSLRTSHRARMWRTRVLRALTIAVIVLVLLDWL